ncbi:MAG: hypothetical protein K1000chlam1_00765 [Candidatus Anoxychlamydiales bacterium]|nr:hypothetical protein [Candidatus Anoxychlamydiales bacterium]
MRKKILVLFTMLGFIFSNALIAEPVEVPKQDKEESSYKKKNWQPWTVAIVSILIAVTGILLVKNKKGKKD